MPDEIVQEMPTSVDEAKESAMSAFNIGWTGVLVLVGLGVTAFLALLLKSIPGIGSAIDEGQRLLTGQSQAQESNDAAFNPFA